jgi:hypothetical protein
LLQRVVDGAVAQIQTRTYRAYGGLGAPRCFPVLLARQQSAVGNDRDAGGFANSALKSSIAARILSGIKIRKAVKERVVPGRVG